MDEIKLFFTLTNSNLNIYILSALLLFRNCSLKTR